MYPNGRGKVRAVLSGRWCGGGGGVMTTRMLGVMSEYQEGVSVGAMSTGGGLNSSSAETW